MYYVRPAVIALLALAALLVMSSRGQAQSFNPTSTYGVSDSTPGASADIESTFSIPAPDLMYANIINFTPPEWGVYRDDDVPDGAWIADLSANATLGLIGDRCSNRLGVGFHMLDATTDRTTQVPFNDQFDIGPDGLPLGVTRYPDYLTRIFKDPEGATLTPIARMYGQTDVAGVEMSLNFVLFEPGIVFKTPAGDTITMDSRLGYVSATVLQAAGDPDTEAKTGDNNAISDFCSPLTTETTIFAVTKDNPDTAANEGGVAVRTNPAAGSYNFVTYALSQRDADGDGIQNGMDPCPTTPNPNWDPYKKLSDPAYSDDQDEDSLPDECDPKPNDKGCNAGGVWDHDCDMYGNRGDNCPLVANSADQPGGTGSDNQEDSDSDGIGDACDDNPNTPDGEQFKVCLVSQIPIGGGGTPPDPAPQNMQPCDPNAALPVTLTAGLSAQASATTVGPGSSVTLTTTLGDANGKPKVGENIVFKIESQPGSEANLVFAGIPRLAASNSTKANLQGKPEVTKVTDNSAKATATLNVGSAPGDIAVSITGGGETKKITIKVSAEAPTTTTTGDGVGGPSTGVGSLAPVASSIPAWATIVSAIGGAGLLGSLGALASRIFGIRLPRRRD